ncbi:MAG: hypothetical protein NC033_00325 [Clostridiales bacterium]|nr:hypothetical protein [Clostridiales bacterium]
MANKNKKPDDLDTETTFADMNVEGFRWYNPQMKKRKDSGMKKHKPKTSRKEYWQMVRAAFAAYAPVFLIVILAFGIVALIAWLWVGM